jgi:hypothetical protein
LPKSKTTLSSLRLIALILWVPFLLEATFIPFFTISIPGSPLSFGRICLLGLGVIGINFKNKQLSPSPFRKVVLLLVLGSFVGTVFSQDLGKDFISYLGFSLLLVSAFGAANLIPLPETQKLLKYFFYAVYLYWVIYVFSMTITGGKLTTYGEIYRANRETDASLINYHAFGLVISTAIVFLAQLNGWLKKLNFIGVSFMLTGILAIFVTESRANLLITLLVLLMLYIANNRLKVTVAFRLGILLVLVGYVASFAMRSNERLSRRYDVQNTEYIQQSTESRFVFIALTFNELIELPFGGGVKNTRVDFYGTEFQPHNQYLTFILFSGIFGLMADIIWFFIFSRTLIKVVKINLDYYKPHLAALTVTMLVLFTNDLSGAFFLLMLMFQTWLAREVLSRRKITHQ